MVNMSKSIQKTFCLLAVTIIVFIFYGTYFEETHTFLGGIFNTKYRLSAYPIPIDQCSLHFKYNCNKEVLNRNIANKWIAVWITSEVEVDVSHLTRIPGWKTVVVGDGYPPKGCRKPSCVFLDPASQAALGSSLAPLLPPNDPARKNLAYLYAIKQRAGFIYDTNSNIQPLHSLTNFFYGNTSGLVYTGKGIFNYHKHYGEHWCQPPGFVNLLSEENDSFGYVLSDIPQPEVQYGLVKVKDNSGPRFQSVVPTVFVGSQSFAPFDSSNTMFHKRAFWGLFTLPRKESDILRSYIVQALLKYIHGYVGFLHSNARQRQVLQTQKGNIRSKFPNGSVWFLYEWQCRDNRSLRTCIVQLASDLLAEEYITEQDWLMMEAWLSDLTTFDFNVSVINVHEPVKLTPKTNKPGVTSNPGKHTPKPRRLKKKDKKGQSVHVELSTTPGVYYNNNPKARTYNFVSTMCENFTYPQHVSYQFHDILLIVTFNYPFLYKNIVYVESLYRRYFPHILLCGPDVDSFRSAVTSLPVNSSVAYVTGIERGWKYFQECTVYAMKMNFNVKGYLQIGEDTLVNSWNLRNISRDQLWFNSKTRVASRNNTGKEGWVWWPRTFGKVALNLTFEHIQTVAKKPGDTKEKRFFKQYVKNVKNFHIVYHQTCDFFYIPNRLKEEFIYFTRLFFNSTLLVEAVIPTMIMGLDDKENIARVKGKVIWGKGRNKPERHFDPEIHYLHAFKGLQQMKKPNCKAFMCGTFLPTLVKRMGDPVHQISH